MGRRFWLGIGILVLFLALSLLTTASMTRIHACAAQLLEQAGQTALSGDLPSAMTDAQRAFQIWQDNWNYTASLADHNPMDDVDLLFAELQVYGQSEEIPHFAACCAQLSKAIQAMYTAHLPTWWNFL